MARATMPSVPALIGYQASLFAAVSDIRTSNVTSFAPFSILAWTSLQAKPMKRSWFEKGLAPKLRTVRLFPTSSRKEEESTIDLMAALRFRSFRTFLSMTRGTPRDVRNRSNKRSSCPLSIMNSEILPSSIISRIRPPSVEYASSQLICVNAPLPRAPALFKGWRRRSVSLTRLIPAIPLAQIPPRLLGWFGFPRIRTSLSPSR